MVSGEMGSPQVEEMVLVEVGPPQMEGMVLGDLGVLSGGGQ